VAQHVFDMQPCPWCILQRLIFLLIAVVAVVAALVPPRLPRLALGALLLVLAGCGIAAAIFQHEVASKLYSCDLTLADTIIVSLGLESLLPALFQVTASCADAAVSMLGVPFEYWSLALYVLIGAGTLLLMLRRAAV
jgi:disulfide bond formation protein DsbB